MREARADDLNYRKLWLALGWVMIGTVIYLSLTPRLPPEALRFFNADKLGHLLAYAILMAWFCQLFWHANERLKLGIVFAAMGIALEFVQGLLGYRYFDYADMLANVLGVFAGWMLVRTRFRYSLSVLDRYISAVGAR